MANIPYPTSKFPPKPRYYDPVFTEAKNPFQDKMLHFKFSSDTTEHLDNSSQGIYSGSLVPYMGMTIQHLLENYKNETVETVTIPLPNIKRSTFDTFIALISLVRETLQSQTPPKNVVDMAFLRPDPMKDRYKQFELDIVAFLRELSLDALVQLILAANFLDHCLVLDWSLEYVATQIRGKSVEELRKLMDIPKDGNWKDKQAYERILKEDAWVEEMTKNEDCK